MQSSVCGHDAFSNNKTWKEIQICHAKLIQEALDLRFVIGPGK